MPGVNSSAAGSRRGQAFLLQSKLEGITQFGQNGQAGKFKDLAVELADSTGTYKFIHDSYN